jgi:diacylglycerol kinase family enzyme
LGSIKKLFNGTVREMKDFEFIDFKNLKIKRNKPGIYHADGEVFTGESIINISVIPSSLNIIVP